MLMPMYSALPSGVSTTEWYASTCAFGALSEFSALGRCCETSAPAGRPSAGTRLLHGVAEVTSSRPGSAAAVTSASVGVSSVNNPSPLDSIADSPIDFGAEDEEEEEEDSGRGSSGDSDKENQACADKINYSTTFDVW